MEPLLSLEDNVEILRHSPFIRGLSKSLSYAETHGSIGLTQSWAMNCKFVTWAAEHFDWPGYTADELYEFNKVLDEYRMPPLEVVHDLLLHLKLVRRYKGTLRLTKKGRELTADPMKLFNCSGSDVI